MTDNRILYLECASGISGDMTVAALLDLGADEKKLRQALDSLQLDGAQVHISRVKKSGLDACDFAVELDPEHENHDHDMAYLHGHEHMDTMHVHNHGHLDEHDHEHEHHGEYDYAHGHGHEHHDGHVHHHDHHHHHEHRGLNEITQIIERADLTDGARALALRIFDILADAEAKAHGVPREEVHFHEVGAVDSIIDIVAAAVCLDDLAPARIICSPLAEGCGTVRCQHGVLPIPVPAVTNIVAAHGLVIQPTQVRGELVTPTGAAIAAAVQTYQSGRPDGQETGQSSDSCVDSYTATRTNAYTIEDVGIGAGKRDYATAGILRAMWVRPCVQPPAEQGRIVKLEANIDDATGEQLGYCMECLMRAGARDVSFVPIYMKKNRPAYELHVICDPAEVGQMEDIIFRETTTIGIRRCLMERRVMRREIQTVETEYGVAQVKVCSYGAIRKVYPEYGSVVELCQKSKQDFRKVYQAVCAKFE